MLQLIYCSTTSAAAVDHGDMVALCEEAARNNSRYEVTGILLLYGLHYLQVLEGPRAIVEDTFLRIIGDQRHHSLRVLSRRLIGFREFGEFAMIECSRSEDKLRAIERIRGILASSEHRRTYDERFAMIAG